MALSYKLWLSKRFFPLTPVFDFLPPVADPLDFVIIYALAILIALNFVYPPGRKLVIALIAVLFILAISDQNRWQPWFFQYFFMLIVFTFTSPPKLRFTETEIRFKMLQLIIAGVYFWSGMNKLNSGFYNEVLPWLTQPYYQFLPESLNFIIKYFTSSIPFIEIFIGIGLFLPKIRKVAIVLAIVTHLFILIVLGPLGYNYNSVIWPWNAAMMLFVVLLFFNVPVISAAHFKALLKWHAVKMIFLLFWLMPFFNLFNRWPAYLSFHLFSGNTSEGTIYLSDKTVSFLPEELSNYLGNETNPAATRTRNIINIKAWSMNELRIPAYPEKRVFNNAKSYFYQFAKDSGEVVMVYKEKSSLFKKPQPEVY